MAGVRSADDSDITNASIRYHERVNAHLNKMSLDIRGDASLHRDFC
jgi:hypothetical protein